MRTSADSAFFASAPAGQNPVNPVEERAAAWGHAALPDAPLAEEATSTVRPSPFALRPLSEDIFNYIYGVLHTPAYREKYREFLKIDFPRIPYPKSAEQFWSIAEIGAKLVQVHLLKDPNVTNPFANHYARFEGTGDCRVEKAVFQLHEAVANPVDAMVSIASKQKEASVSDAIGTIASTGKGISVSDGASSFGRVYINAGQYFDNVPQAAWNAFIGGYQPTQKWLKDRKGRVLTSDELAHYKSIIKALVETAKLTAQLSAFEP